jgi:hypothetical protein
VLKNIEDKGDLSFFLNDAGDFTIPWHRLLTGEPSGCPGTVSAWQCWPVYSLNQS